MRTLLLCLATCATLAGIAPAQAQIPPAEPGCHPSYRGACLPPAGPDVDCIGGTGNGPLYVGRVWVVAADPYGLDRDGDGIACEEAACTTLRATTSRTC